MTKLRKNPALSLVLACYAAGLLVFLLVHLAGFVQNRLAYQNGSLQTATLTLEDFTFQDLELQENGTLLSVDGDPQLLLKDTARKVENVTITAHYRLDPLVVNVFWAKPGEGEGPAYTPRRMAYGQDTDEGQRFWLPASGGQALRIDPGAKIGNTIDVQSIVINQKRPFYAFFIPTAGEVALLAIAPALAACALWLAGGLLPANLREKLAKKAGGAHD